jgi:multiple sugar transport system ATP-binding protein
MGGTKAVRDFNLAVEDKEFVVIVGPSGCGKSTTIRMVAGLEDITAGEIFIGGRCINHMEPKERDIAMVFQNYALFSHMTVFQNMAFGLQQRRTPKAQIAEKVRKAAEILEIVPLLQRKPGALSGGERQRVALGRAIVRDPAVFLLDEPLSNLDAKMRAAMRAEIAKLHQRLGATFLYVTHDQIEAMTMGERIVVMQAGEIQQVDTPENLYLNPCNTFVAGFIGSPPMNLGEGAVTKQGDGFALEIGGVRFELPRARFPEETLAGYAGREVVWGLRPENIFPEFFYAGEADHLTGRPVLATTQAVEGEVFLSEMTGADTYLHVRIPGKDVICRVSSGLRHRQKGKLKLIPDLSRLVLFDQDSGRNLRDAV